MKEFFLSLAGWSRGGLGDDGLGGDLGGLLGGGAADGSAGAAGALDVAGKVDAREDERDEDEDGPLDLGRDREERKDKADNPHGGLEDDGAPEDHALDGVEAPLVLVGERLEAPDALAVLVHLVPPAQPDHEPPGDVLGRPKVEREAQRDEHKRHHKVLDHEVQEQVHRDRQRLEEQVEERRDGVRARAAAPALLLVRALALRARLLAVDRRRVVHRQRRRAGAVRARTLVALQDAAHSVTG